MEKVIKMNSGRSIREQVSDAEWQLRVDLAACYRLMAHFRMTDLIYNHITARVPGTDHQVLINDYGLHYEEITASNLLKIDLEGNILLAQNPDCEVNYPGYVIHSAVHAAREDAACVIHTHTRATMAVAAMQCGLLPLSQIAMRFYNRISYHDYEGPAVDLDERVRLVADLGKNDAMLLKNHGTLVVGRSVPEAFNLIYFLEMACQAQVDTLSSGMPYSLPAKAAAEKAASVMQPVNDSPHGSMDGTREWPAMLRMMDRRDASFRN
jgi:ribulose-5-phosphate 4-epimerase/fuculose-1-phosphate aldolase